MNTLRATTGSRSHDSTDAEPGAVLDPGSGEQDMSNQVEFQRINKDYAGTPAVIDLNLAVRQGEFLTVLGPSGSGKTTTLRMLAGLESVSSGRILVAGRDVSRDVPEKRNIGMVFQNYALFPHLTVTQNIGFPLRMRRVGKAEMARHVERVLELTGLTDFAKRYPRQLSGGQQQRVALARSFVFDPSILLMDEPLGALDRNLRDHMRIELKALQKRIGATVLYVTHDQDEALAMSDRIAVMHKGVLQQVDTPTRLYEHPCNSFVARFLGDSISLQASRASAGSRVLNVEGVSNQVAVEDEGDVCCDDRGVFMVRPEKLRLSTSEPTVDGENRVCGVVETAVYLGSKLQVFLRDNAAGARLQAVVPPDQAHLATPGTTLWAAWRTADSRFLPYVA